MVYYKSSLPLPKIVFRYLGFFIFKKIVLMLSVTKEFTFDAAHSLGNGYVGKCQKMHGHTYRLQVTAALVEGATVDQFGMVIDFSDIKKVWKEELEPIFDHCNLNETLEFQTTAENMAKYLFEQFSIRLNTQHRKIVQIDLYETPTSKATYSMKFPEYLSNNIKK